MTQLRSERRNDDGSRQEKATTAGLWVSRERITIQTRAMSARPLYCLLASFLASGFFSTVTLAQTDTSTSKRTGTAPATQ
jgi:hypothetical protein